MISKNNITILLLLSSGCGEDTLCFNVFSGVRILVFDSENNDLLAPGFFTIESFVMEDGSPIDYQLIDYSIDPNDREGIWNIKTTSSAFRKCFENDCQFYLKLKSDSGIDTDTFTMQFVPVREDGCYGEEVIRFELDGEAVSEFHPRMGGYIIRKSITR